MTTPDDRRYTEQHEWALLLGAGGQGGGRREVLDQSPVSGEAY